LCRKYDTRVRVTSEKPGSEREPDRAGNGARSRDVKNEKERERRPERREKKKNAPVEQLLCDSPECRHVICVYERAGA